MYWYEKGYETLDELLINGGPGITEFAEIIQDTARKNHFRAKSQREREANINSAIHDAKFLFSNYISSFDNKHIYNQIIKNLIQYSFLGYKKNGKKINSIIDTNWDDFNLYFQHIKFITNFQKKYKLKAIYWKDRKKMYLLRPFGKKLSLELQELVLNFNYCDEINLGEFVLRHTKPLLEYLKMRFYSIKGFYNYKNSHLNVSFENDNDDEILKEYVTLSGGKNVILKDLIFSDLEKRIAPDGIEYTKQEFEDYFGGLEEWDYAIKSDYFVELEKWEYSTES